MKSKILTYWIFLGLMLFASCQGLFAQNAQIEPASSMAQLEASFQSRPFTPQQFEAYSVRGEQKLRDFVDYVSFLSSETVEDLWKAHIVEQVKGLFIKDSVNCLGKATVSAFLKEAYLLAEDASHLEIEVVQPFEKKENQFRALLGTKFYFENEKTTQVQVELYLLKRPKTFGEDVISVWEVLLGDVKRL